MKSGDFLGESPFLLIGDHAGRAIPAVLGDLGLPQAERGRHIAVDIGVEELGQALAGRLAAPFLRQVYSRLVIDCNRDPARADAVPTVSDETPVPGNVALSEADRQERIAEIYTPYHAAIAEALDARAAAGRETILVSLHSFTPVMGGVVRPCHIGVLHDAGDPRFALRLLKRMRRQSRFVVADNEPYAMDGTDYTVPHHAFPRGLAYVELEVRQDLIDPRGGDQAAAIGELLATALKECAAG